MRNIIISMIFITLLGFSCLIFILDNLLRGNISLPSVIGWSLLIGLLFFFIFYYRKNNSSKSNSISVSKNLDAKPWTLSLSIFSFIGWLLFSLIFFLSNLWGSPDNIYFFLTRMMFLIASFVSFLTIIFALFLLSKPLFSGQVMKIIFIVYIVLSFSVFGLIYQIEEHKDTIDSFLTNRDFCDKLPNSDTKDRCYLDIALETNDVSLCENVFDEKYCRYIIAQKSMDYTVCKDDWICITDVAEKTKNPDLCKKIEGLKESQLCFASMAYKLNDLSLCEYSTETMGVCVEYFKSKKN